MSRHQERESAHGRQPSPSMSELLASCAAADAVSTPPEDPAAEADDRPGDDSVPAPGTPEPERRAA